MMNCVMVINLKRKNPNYYNPNLTASDNFIKHCFDSKKTFEAEHISNRMK